MKKLFLFLSLFYSIQAFSQISVGFTGGIIFPVTKSNKDSLPYPYSGFKTGGEFLAGSSHWKFKTGIEYVSFTFAEYNPYQLNPYNRYKAAYLSIPVGLRYIFGGKKIKPFIDGSVCFLVNVGKKDIPDKIVPKNFLLSPALGLGVLANSEGKIYFSFSINYAVQAAYILTTIKNNEIIHTRYNNINTQLSVGYNF